MVAQCGLARQPGIDVFDRSPATSPKSSTFSSPSGLWALGVSRFEISFSCVHRQDVQNTQNTQNTRKKKSNLGALYLAECHFHHA